MKRMMTFLRSPGAQNDDKRIIWPATLSPNQMEAGKTEDG